jgi:hypothetical protein
MNATALVLNPRTLAAMARRGFIVWEPNETTRHWTGQRVPVRYVEAGPALTFWYDEFRYRGGRYRLTYVDGCFMPFVMRLDTPAPVPAFV